MSQLLLESLVVQVEQMRYPFDFGLGANLYGIVKVLVLFANEIDVANVQDGRQYFKDDLLLRFAESENVDGRNERSKVFGVVFMSNGAIFSLKKYEFPINFRVEKSLFPFSLFLYLV